MMKSRKRRKGKKETNIHKGENKGQKQGRSERRRKNAESQEKTCYQLVYSATERLTETSSRASRLC
jgi:hypothetical protein